MGENRGKKFEQVVRDSFNRIDDTYVLRLYDPQGGYSSVANPCDFIVFRHNRMYMIECKTIHGNTFPIFSNDPKKKFGNISTNQGYGMLRASQYGVVAGVIIWWVDRDVTRFIPIGEIEAMNYGGDKSIRYDTDRGILIDGKKKRVFFDYNMETFFENFENEG